MKINGWDIKGADARQWNVTPGFQSIKNESEWIEGSTQPVLVGSRLGFKEIKVRILVKREGGRQAIIGRCSEILAHLLEPAELELDGFEHKFHAIMTKYQHEETAMQRWHVLTVYFNAYEYGAQEAQSFSGRTELTIENPGNVLTPATVEITPQIGVALLVVTGLCRDPDTGADLPIRVQNLVTGKKVVFDGETGLVTQAGELKAGDVEFWDIPTLRPGTNNITVDSSRMDITVRFHPRYM